MAKRIAVRKRGTVRRAIACTAAALHLPPAAFDAESPPARVIASRAGASWLVTVVARMTSEDVATGAVTGRLVLRFECMSSPERSDRIVTVRAASLDDLGDDTLRSALYARIRGKSR